MNPIVSVILTSYNKPKTIGNAIESVLNQTFGNWELFIMDDNSQKEIVEIIKRYVNDPRIHYFNSHIQDSERYTTTRYATLINEAIPMTKGKYITYLTDDNFFLPERFEMMVKVLNRDPNIEIVYSKQLVRWMDENGSVEREAVRKTYGILTNPVGLVDHCSIMHTRKIADDVLKKFGSYWDDNPKYWFNGDAVFWQRLTKFKPFYPIRTILDIASKDPESFQILYTHLPKKIPNGTLVRGLSSDVYIIDNQERRKISPDVFDKMKFHPKQVVRIPDPFLFKYNEGVPVDSQVFLDPALFPNQRLIMSSQNPSVYFFQNHKKHLIRNDKAFDNYKFQRNQIVFVSDDFLAQIPDGLPIEELSREITILPDGVLFQYQSFYYISLNQHLHPIVKQVAIKLNLPVSDPVRMDHTLLTKFKQGEPFVW
jgi:spore maturation protein CgeD